MLTNESIFLINSLTEQNGKSVKELARRYQISQKSSGMKLTRLILNWLFYSCQKSNWKLVG